MRLMIHEILEKAAAAQTREEKASILIEHNCLALRDVLRGSFDDSIEFTLPKGKPPYEEDDAPHGYTRSSLYQQTKKFKYFVKGGPGDQLLAARRERMFIEILEGIHPKEAELIIAMKDKKLAGPPSMYKGITKKLVSDTFKGLIRK
jgi:hypothetical protein